MRRALRASAETQDEPWSYMFSALAMAEHDARVRAETAEQIAVAIEALPTTRTQAWLTGWDSVSQAEAARIAREIGGAS